MDDEMKQSGKLTPFTQCALSLKGIVEGRGERERERVS